MGFGVYKGLGFRVGLGFRIYRVCDLGFRALGYGVCGLSGFRLGFTVRRLRPKWVVGPFQTFFQALKNCFLYFLDPLPGAQKSKFAFLLLSGRTLGVSASSRAF